jgi:hypothetical protein
LGRDVVFAILFEGLNDLIDNKEEGLDHLIVEEGLRGASRRLVLRKKLHEAAAYLDKTPKLPESEVLLLLNVPLIHLST